MPPVRGPTRRICVGDCQKLLKELQKVQGLVGTLSGRIALGPLVQESILEAQKYTIWAGGEDRHDLDLQHAVFDVVEWGRSWSNKADLGHFENLKME